MIYYVKPSHISHVGSESKTVPDDSMSMKEIVTRFTRGQKLDGMYREPIYDSGANFDSQDLEALSRMDAMEMAQYQDILKQDIEGKKADLKAAEKAVKDRAKALALKNAEAKTGSVQGEGKPSATGEQRAGEGTTTKQGDPGAKGGPES